MANLSDRWLAFLQRLTRLEKALLLLAGLQLVYQSVYRIAGVTLPLDGLLTLVFVAAAFLTGIKYSFWLFRRTVWRLRNRLILAYAFIGVVPIVLILAMLGIGMYILMGQVATYLMTAEMNRRNEVVRDCAYALAWNVADHLGSDQGRTAAGQFIQTLRRRLADLQAVLHVDGQTFRVPATAGVAEFPRWSQHGFLGLIAAGREHALAAHVGIQQAAHVVEVFAYEPADASLLGKLLPGLASISLLVIDDDSPDPLARREKRRLSQQPEAAPQSDGSAALVRFGAVSESKGESREPTALQPPRSWWDIAVRWGTPFPVRRWESTSTENSQVLVRVVSRPSLIIRRLFSTLGPLTDALKLVLYIVGGLLLLVEVASLVFGMSLTRTITRSVADLYEGTVKVNSGDFSNRIPIRSNDQLSELAASFNRMTANVEKLIIESKEKERLESELEIAREVQSQLFPKCAPRLKTLQLAGACRPARMVSGDYYDFIPLSANWTALAIGDIAGKGISAALLMASIQSSLRAQLNSNHRLTAPQPGMERFSTSDLTALLNTQLYESTSPEKFATFFCALYDEETSRLVYTNAGHLPPILIRQGKARRLEVNGMVLGAFPNQSYEKGCFELRAGDLLAAYTDGITEPENEYGEEFGERRLTELLIRNAGKPLEELIGVVTSAAGEWGSASEQQDDMTLLLLRRI
ncbi:MAG: SpoIIE family protein phosphatase [Acidobacteria bacterium]|nr:SpoIIE family protein phosphatase [Acidobacteriota bacterium]MCI0718652.1 SpoIIE family protein phosphatase [Acidobacteriota bacterium]